MLDSRPWISLMPTGPHEVSCSRFSVSKGCASLVDEDEVLADERSTCAPAHVRVGIAHVAQGRLTDELTQNFFKP